MKMSPKLKEKLYVDLNNLLTLLEDGGINIAKRDLQEITRDLKELTAYFGRSS